MQPKQKSSQAKPRQSQPIAGLRHLFQFWNTDRCLTMLLVMLVFVLFVVTPFASGSVIGTELNICFFSILAVTGVAAVARRPVMVLLLAATAVSSLALDLVAHIGGSVNEQLADLMLRVGFVVLLGFVVMHQVFRPGSITHHRVQGAVVVYLLAGLAWAHLYDIVHLMDPDAIRLSLVPAAKSARFALFQYFSFETLTTLGYGDILPIGPFPRALASSEALFGQLYPALMIARLVTLELHARAK